jgi:hypothetical protein
VKGTLAQLALRPDVTAMRPDQPRDEADRPFHLPRFPVAVACRTGRGDSADQRHGMTADNLLRSSVVIPRRRPAGVYDERIARRLPTAPSDMTSVCSAVGTKSGCRGAPLRADPVVSMTRSTSAWGRGSWRKERARPQLTAQSTICWISELIALRAGNFAWCSPRPCFLAARAGVPRDARQRCRRS